MRKILIVAAHPDDEVLGCGGTVARLISEGCEAYTLILGEGVTSRDEGRDVASRKDDLQHLNKDIEKANAILGVKDVFTFNLPDNRFDTVPLLDIVKIIEQIKQKIQPDTIFTHSAGDLNIDHQVTNKAVITATRPMVGETVKDIYAFEILSSTEWNFPVGFSANLFFDISKGMDKKIEAMECYAGELRDFPHPRSLEGIALNAKQWGMKVGYSAAEAFEVLRCLK